MGAKCKTTILLTIYNRYKFTKRWLDYAKENNFKINIFICDGGTNNAFKKYINLNKYKSLNIKYYKSEYTTDFSIMFNKFYEAVQRINTDFIYIAEDDDFIIEENIFKSQTFLEKNLDYSSSGGLNVNFEYLSKKKGNGKIFIRCHNHNKSLKDDDVLKRFMKGFKYLNSNYNTLHTKKSLIKIFKFLKMKKFKNLYITELVIYLYSLLNGKCKRFDHVEYLKLDNTQYSASKNFEKNYLKNIVFSKTFSQENYYFINFLNKFFLSNCKKYKTFKNLYFDHLLKDLNIRLEKQNRIIFFIRKKITNSFFGYYIKFLYKFSKYYNLNNINIFFDKKGCKRILINDKKNIIAIHNFLDSYEKF
jgi:glycosyltransferase domain-containing protein